jgi:toxin-antitoxin system PIN domain toxin
VKLVDANVLIYAVNADAQHHAAARSWLDDAMSGSDTVGLAWPVLLAFLRLTTRTGLFERPLPVAAAAGQVRDWLDAPGTVVVAPGPAHAEHLERLLTRVGTGGNLVNDAHLAALALEHRAEVVSYDNDFTRFEGVRWRRPDDLDRPR